MRRIIVLLIVLINISGVVWASDRDFFYVAIRPVYRIYPFFQPDASYLRAAYDEERWGNAFEFSTYALRDTTGYMDRFSDPRVRNMVKVYGVVQVWKADSLASAFGVKKRRERKKWQEETRIPEVMQKMLGGDFQVVANADLSSPQPGRNMMQLTYRGRNCQIIWDTWAGMYLEGWRDKKEKSQEQFRYTLDYSLRDVRWVILGRTASGNYVLLMVTKRLL